MAENKTIASLVAEGFIQKKQDRNALIEKRRAEIYEKIPSFKELEDKISSVSFSLFKKVAEGLNHEDAAKLIREETSALTKKRNALLSEFGFDENYLFPPYDCPLCKDEGFLDNKYCICFQKELIKRTLSEANLASLSGNTFDKFSLSWYSEEKENGKLSPRENMEKILSDCIKFSENFEITEDNLLLSGPSGLGKTFLSSCIANALIEKGVNVIYQSASTVFSLLDRIKFSKNVTDEDLYTADKIFESDLLILDDLGTEFITEFSVSELFRILNTRSLSKKKTIISTNLSLSDIKKIYSERILSRIIGNFVIMNFYGKDIRFLKKL